MQQSRPPQITPSTAVAVLGDELAALQHRLRELESQVRELARRSSGQRRLMTIRQVAESQRYAGFTEQSLRSLVKRGEANGFDRCLRRNGRRIFIDTAAMDRWLEDQARWR